MSYSDLGKKTKAKYAGQYDDLSDDDLGKRIAAKYPGQYDDIAGAAPAAPAASNPVKPIPNRSALDKLDSFTHGANNAFMGGIVRGGAGLVKLLTPDSVDKKIDSVTRRAAPMPNTSTPEGAAGAKLGGAEKFAAETVPQLLLGGGELSLKEGVKPFLKTLAKRAGINAATAGTQAIANSGAEGASSGDQLKAGLTSALANAGLGLAREGVGTVVGEGLRKK